MTICRDTSVRRGHAILRERCEDGLQILLRRLYAVFHVFCGGLQSEETALHDSWPGIDTLQ